MREKRLLKAMLIAMVVFIATLAQAGEKTIVVDDAKRTVNVPAKPKRIVVLNGSNMEMLYAVGGKAVGRPESTGMPAALLNKVKNLPSVGETPNPSVEKIVSLKPDLAIGVNVSFHHQIIPPLEKAGIPILLLSINNYDDILNKLRIYGEITGNFVYRHVSTLSGGERQRAWIAMSLAQKTEILLLDEPTTFLDIHHQLEVLELLERLYDEHKITIIMVIHDINHAAQFSQRIVAIKDGMIIKDSIPTEVITEDIIEKVFNVKARIVAFNDYNCKGFSAVCIPYGICK
jgi:hypothetical protein